MSTYDTPSDDTNGIDHTDLTAFQANLLVVTTRLDRAADDVYGLRIKEELEDLYGHEVNHGRLYPNLDALVDDDLLEKGTIDRRTNSYEVTEAARQLLRDRREELTSALGGEHL